MVDSDLTAPHITGFPLRPKRFPYGRSLFLATLIVGALIASLPGESRAGSVKSDKKGKLAFYVSPRKNAGGTKAGVMYPSRYQRPTFYGKSLPSRAYKGFTLIGSAISGPKIPGNASFFAKTRQAIDLIEQKSPRIYRLMQGMNPRGRRVIAYTGNSGPASFVAWAKDYIVNITASAIDEDPVFENSVYTVSATLVHELVGHGRQQNDGRVWAMYDWCGKSGGKIEGVGWQSNHMGSSSGLIEYEPNLYARWFLETVRGTYPDLNEVAIRRYVKIVRVMKKRFPDWYDERKSSTTLLREFGRHFAKVCPGVTYTPHPVSGD